MKLTPEQREEIVEFLVTNCEEWRGDGDREVLDGFPDGKLQQLKAAADKRHQAFAVANAAVNGFVQGDTAYRVNPTTGKWERRAVTNAAPRRPAPPPPAEEEDDDEAAPPPPKVTRNRRVEPEPPPRRERTKTPEEMMRELPPEWQQNLRDAEQITNQEKARIIDQLLVNVSPGERRAHTERLMTRSLQDLRDDLSRMPKAPTPEEETRRHAATNNRRAPAATVDDLLVSPTMNWSEMDGIAKGKPVRNAAVAPEPEDGGDADAEAEALRNLPPRLRAKIHNAEVVEARERRRLIEDITANARDEAAEKELIPLLEDMPLDKLQALARLSPAKPPGAGRQQYFGSPAPLTNVRPVGDVTEDVLPLPKMDYSERKQA
jgi:hypothetical protein